MRIARVGYVVPAFPQRSETFVELELACLRERDVDVTVCSVYTPPAELRGPTTLPADRLLHRPGRLRQLGHFLAWGLLRPVATSRNVAWALSLRSETMLRGAFAAGWAATVFSRARVQHVHAHFALDATGVAVAAAALLRVPVTCTVHAHELYVRNRALGRRLARLDRVVTVCEYNLAELRARCPELRERDVPIVYCGVDPRRFAPAAHTDRTPVRVVSVGRLVAIKGFDTLLDAMADLRARGDDVVCDIVGAGPLADELASRARTLGVDEHVRFLGALDPAEVGAALRDADVFVLACRVDTAGVRDSMPVVIKEAMASSVPVVSTKVAGVPEMVDDEVGRVVPPDDPGALADALHELVAGGAPLRRQLGAAGRQRIEGRFDARVETGKLLALFEELGRA